jgi:hypothetical protein
MRSDQHSCERGGGEAAVGRAPPARLIRSGLLEIGLHRAGLHRPDRAEGVPIRSALNGTTLGRALRGEFGGVT